MVDHISNPSRWELLQKLVSSTGFRLALITLVGLLMLLPLFLVKQVIQERNQYHTAVIHDMATTWGKPQTLIGPVLVIPYVEHIKRVDTITEPTGEKKVVSNDTFNDHTLLLLPKELEIRTDIKTEQQRQDMYEALVYQSTISVTGSFDHSNVLDDGEGERRILWENAYVAFGLSDTKAVDVTSGFFWDNEKVKLEPGSQLASLLPTGFHAPLKANTSTENAHQFKLTLNVRGSEGLFFAPLGETTKLRITSAWRHPNFSGHLLPAKHIINDQGFNAEWQTPYLVRNYPQQWELDGKQSPDLNQLTVGVNLEEPDTLYNQLLNAAAYGMVFVGLLFLTLFILETQILQRPIAMIHYVLSGLMLAAFYVILLTLAEHIPFLHAYVSAASLTVLILTLYASQLLTSKKQVAFVALLLAALYATLYFLLEQPAYVLPVGTGLLLLTLLGIMYFARRAKPVT